MATQYESTLSEFKGKLSINEFWRFYKIRAIMARESEGDAWKIILMLIVPSGNEVETVGYNTLLEDVGINVIEETRSSDSFDNFLSELFTNGTIRIGNTDSSTELINFEPKIKHIDRLVSKSLIGIERPGDILYIAGPDPDSYIFKNIKTFAERHLLIHDPPYGNIEDVISDLLMVKPVLSTLESNVFLAQDKFRPLLMIFSPFWIRIEHVKVAYDKLNIWTIIRHGVDLNDIKLSIIGKASKPTHILRKLLKYHNIDFTNEVAIQKFEEIGYEPYVFTLRLFYKDQEIDSYVVAREEYQF
jgi:hypothetical protein